MICPSCHAEVADDAAFCSRCGARLVPARPVCPRCGAELPDDAAFCPRCGARVGEEGAPPRDHAVPERPSEPSATPADASEAAGAAAREAVGTAWGGKPAVPDEGQGAAKPPACPSCGAPVGPDDPYCPVCGVRLNGPHYMTSETGTRIIASAPSISPDATAVDMARETAIPESVSFGASVTQPGSTGPMPVVPPPAADRGADAGASPKKMGAGRIAGIAVGVIAAIAVAGGGVWYVTDRAHQQELAEQQAADALLEALHPVTVSVSADGWDTTAGSSRLPVHVTGTAKDGSAVDEVQYVGSDGTGLVLRQGSYQLSVAASPIAADGTVYTVPGTSISLSFESGSTDEQIDATAQGSFALEAVAALDVTDDMIASAYDYAAQDTVEGAASAETLRAAAVKRRDDAAAAQAEEEERQQRDGRHVEAASYAFDLPAYWDGRVNVTVDGDEVHIYSSEFPRLEVCRISVQQGPTQDMGDVALACMGDASIGQGRYASVWANRWGYVIGWAYCTNSPDPDDYYSLDEAEEIVDLQSGGAITYEEIRDDMEANDVSSDLVFIMDDYLKAQIVDTIVPLDE